MATTRKRASSAGSPDVKSATAALDRPFDPKVLDRAKVVARTYQVVVGFDPEEGEWYGHGVELPLAMGDGATAEACLRSTQQAIIAVLATMIERGEKLPAPASDEHRTEQVNIRLTAAEKVQLETTARRGGFRGVSDYVRAAALGNPIGSK